MISTEMHNSNPYNLRHLYNLAISNKQKNIEVICVAHIAKMEAKDM